MAGAAVAVLVIEFVEDVLVELVVIELLLEDEVKEVFEALDVDLAVPEIEEVDPLKFEDTVPEAVIVT